MLKRRKRKTVEVSQKDELPAGGSQTKLASADSVEADYARQISDNDEQQALLEKEAMSRIKLPAHTRKTEVLMKHIRTTSHKDPETTANVLRTWIADGDDRISS